MKTTLSQLGGDENVLLVYVAGELSAADQKAVELRLQREPALAAKLAEIQSLTAPLETAAIDDQWPELSLRRVIRESQEAMHELAAAPKLPTGAPKPASLPLPWWTYPLAAAASIVVAISVFVANMDPAGIGPLNTPLAVGVPDLFSASMPQDNTLEADDIAATGEQIADSLDVTEELLAHADSPLFAADREMADLRESAALMEEF